MDESAMLSFRYQSLPVYLAKKSVTKVQALVLKTHVVSFQKAKQKSDIFIYPVLEPFWGKNEQFVVRILVDSLKILLEDYVQ